MMDDKKINDGDCHYAKASGEDAESEDAFRQYLMSEYRRTRMFTLVLAICGLSLLLIAVALNQSGVMSFNVYNVMMTLAYLFIVITAVFGLARMRPFKKRLKAINEVSSVGVIDPKAADGVRMEKRATMDMDGFYQVFERGIRTELVPEMAGYRRLRRIWLSILLVAGVVAVASSAAYAIAPEWSVACTIGMVVAFSMVIVAFYIDRTRMKPMRDEWARERGMTEMEARNNMR